jgi:carboxyl-terminal processing protease
MTRRSIRIALAPVLLVVLGTACGQPPDPAPAAAAAPTKATIAAPGAVAVNAGMRDTIGVPTEPFAGGEKAFATVKEALLHGYSGTAVTEDDLYRAAVQGMLEHVDPARGAWNKLLPPAEFEALHSDLQGQVVGIGAEIDFDEATGYSEVLGTFPSSPAEKAGVLPGDKILDVNGKLFKGKTQKDVLGEIRGKAGDTVTLTVLRADKLLTIPIVREVVAYEVVRDMMLGESSGYLRIKSFNAKTRPAIDRGLDDLTSHAAKSLVVDLRGNPGGGFDDAIASAEAFLLGGTVIARIQKRGEAEKTFTAKGATRLTGVPMVVLVDGDTSSGGEIIAAALQQGRHAQVVGARTFGKWSLQTVDDLPNGYAIKYTISVIKAADGKTYDGVGFAPDIQVDMDRKATAAAQRELDPTRRLAIDPQLRTAVALLRPR